VSAFPEDPIDFLFSLERLGMKFGLENITTLCAALGHPERAFRSVLIAGTNGKGSVTAMVEAALRNAGTRTARYTSPHLARLEERFVIQGIEVSRHQLSEAAARVRDTVADLITAGTFETPPTFFECTTATAFELFRGAGVEIAVLEVGLGGRLDATNVVAPVVTAITSIALDHEAQLGNTIPSVAREKAGIIKPGVPVVCGPLPPDAERVIREVCAARGARFVGATGQVGVTVRGDGTLDIRHRGGTIEGVRLSLAGAHQRQNAAVAVAILEELADAGVSIPDHAVRDALENVQWPGRIERFTRDEVEIVLDAAHNPAGAAALAAYLAGEGWQDATLVIGVMRDKDARGMLEPLLRGSTQWGLVICTTPPGVRALPAADLATMAAEAAAGRYPILVEEDPEAALHRARARRRPAAVAGSIFLIGPLRDILR
jgi:dihydrofolate synthase/folylpolyglutamate synthase